MRQAAEALAKVRADAAALEQAAAASHARAAPPPKTDHDNPTAHDDDAAYLEAATVANLHAQAIGVQNIKALVPIVLNPMSAHYCNWCGYVLLTLGCYSLSDHVLNNASFPLVPAWTHMDCVVLSWIYNSVSPDLLEIGNHRGNPTARYVWLSIEKHFLGNSETRALCLDAEFRHLVQGDLSINEYCSKMKSMADTLGDLGETVHDRTLVLNILRGLNEKFQYMAALIQRQKPFPSYDDVLSDLPLEEINMGNRASSSTTALVTMPSPAVALPAAPARPPLAPLPRPPVSAPTAPPPNPGAIGGGYWHFLITLFTCQYRCF